MKIKITKKYLVFPTNVLAARKRLTFNNDGKTVYELDINLDYENPNFYAYVDLSRFIGEELTLSVAPKMELAFRECECIDREDLYREPYRPLVHFTTANGWINDPNGLIYLDGTYHMFYQHNPCSVEWGNMHWGHATSPDLIHWKEEPVALFPDSTGTMYSGSAILDKDNRTGLGNGGAPALLFYTATSPFSQYMAYSNDGFKTVTKYGPPIIPTLVNGNRDPKVVWCEELNAYIMALFIEKDIYGIFRSDDLVSFTEIQRLSLSGDRECPDIFSTIASDGKTKWVLMGANNRYAVGTLNKDGFIPEQATYTLHYGNAAYAGQTFSGMGAGRAVRIDWDRWSLRCSPFTGQMSIPYELKLIAEDGIYRLTANPVPEFESLYCEPESYTDITVGADALFLPLDKKAHTVKLSMPVSDGELYIDIFGRRLCVMPGEGELKFGKDTVPLSITGGPLDITLIVDTASIELFLDGGRIYASFINNSTVMDLNLPYLSLSAKGEMKIDALTLIPLNSIH